jgi:FMN phosphatase YigB (HAD superfamily)
MRELLCRFKDGGSRLYGLSNWSYKVYEVIRKYPIFSLLDGMVISSDVHLLKPDSRIYQCLMEKYGLQNEDCVFIDDRKDNVEAAQKLKMQGIVFEDALQLRLKL